MNSLSSQKSTKTRILEEAIKLFGSKSYAKVSIAEIADHVLGIQKSTVFYHFKTKLNLAEKALVHLSKSFGAFNERDFSQLDSPRKKLEFVVDGMLMIIQDYPNIVGFFLEIFEEFNQNEKAFGEIFQIFEKYGKIITRILAESNVPNPTERMLVMLSSLDGIAVYGKMFLESPESQKLLGPNFLERYREVLISMVLGK